MRNFILVLFAICAASVAQAQHMSVESFQMDGADLDARVNAAVLDQNGEKCALIKVESTEKGFSFDVGQLGIKKVDESKVAETWVYVPHGVMRLRVAHADLGILEYEFPMAIREATVYRLKLTSDKVKTIVEESAGGQYLVMLVEPANVDAQLIVGNLPPQPITDGEIAIFLPYGEHMYRIESDLYRTATGSVRIGKDMMQQRVELEPNFGYLVVNSNPKGAEVKVNNFQVGVTPYRSDKLPLGNYVVSLSKKNYRTHQQSSIISVGGETVQVNATLNSYLSDINISCAMPEARILINGQVRGTGGWSGALMPGTYELRTERDGYRAAVQTLVVKENTPQDIVLDAPKPMYGTLNVSSTPIGVTVEIGDEVIGVAPNVFSEVLVGRHEVEFSRKGYASQTMMIEIEEGKVSTHRVVLEKEKEELLTGSVEMVYVEGGSFRMGSYNGESDENPLHSVTLNSYYIGKYEITVTQFAQFANTDNYSGNEDWKYDEYWVKRPLADYNRPVINVSWEIANAYCSWLSKKTGKKFRLPTEAEWEFAARGGNKTQGYIYSGSNSIENVAWYKSNSDYYTYEVGQKKPNELGLYDMSGNVMEWCLDWYTDYSSDRQINPKGAMNGLERVLRGGGPDSDKNDCRITSRSSALADSSNGFGFRIVLVVD